MDYGRTEGHDNKAVKNMLDACKPTCGALNENCEGTCPYERSDHNPYTIRAVCDGGSCKVLLLVHEACKHTRVRLGRDRTLGNNTAYIRRRRSIYMRRIRRPNRSARASGNLALGL